MDVRKGRRQRWCIPKGERCSRAAHGQESQEVQQGKRVGKERSDEPSKC